MVAIKKVINSKILIRFMANKFVLTKLKRFGIVEW